MPNKYCLACNASLSEIIPLLVTSPPVLTLWFYSIYRGQESSGMVTYDGNQMFVQKGMGLVSNVYGTDTAKHLTGHIGIGHNRYSTAGKSEMINCQPFVVDTVHGKIAVAHNGELVNAKSIRQRLLKHGIGLSSETDSELITQLMVSEPPGGEPNGADWAARIKHLMELIKCSYSVVVLTSHGLFGFRDPHGNRPLCIGKCDTSFAINHENGKKQLQEAPVWIFSSESCAFHSIGATLVREVEPGEIVQLTENGINSVGLVKPDSIDIPPAFCIFEYVYFSRADSVIEGQLVYEVRKESGRQLALEASVKADIVSTIPESATPSAFGFSEASGIPYREVLVKNRYVGRTFIQPCTRLRKLGVKTKFGPLTQNFEGKRIVLLDDSIVRGNTMGPIIQLLKSSGAKEVRTNTFLLATYNVYYFYTDKIL